MAQTAVEHLMNHFRMLHIWHDGEPDEMLEAFEQAMLMQEQHIRMAWIDGHALGKNGLVVVDYSNSKEYYDKYYKR